MHRFIYVALIIGIFIAGCSGGGTTVMPSEPDAVNGEASERHHMLWGSWQGVIDPDAQTLEFVPLRVAEFHLNALPFLEPPPLLNLTLESLEFNGNIIEADIGLRHPFLGLTEFTGFDVCGVFISNGSVSGFTDSDLVMAGEGDTRLLNPDGYSRWWNPAEFPMDGTIFGYTDGLLGAPDSFADYNATLNGYKYFCDDLEDVNDPLTEIVLENRGMFSAGQKNVRHYIIDMGSGLIFNYAIDASWQFPEGDAPWTAPDDFAPEANRPEAWRISVTETENTLWNDGVENGGEMTLQVDVYDWVNAGLNTLRVESPGNFTMVESSSAIGGGEGYSTYSVEITAATPAEEEIDLLISVISEVEDFNGFIPGVNVTAYFTHTSPVSPETPTQGFDIILDSNYSFDSGFYDFAPSIVVSPSGIVYVTYAKHYNTYQNTTSDYEYSVDNGDSWITPGWSSYGTSAHHPMITVAVCDPNGDVYHLINGFNYGIWSLIVKFTNPGVPNSGIYICGVTHGTSFIFTYDGFPIGFGDYGNIIRYKKGNTAYTPHWNNGWIWPSNYGTQLVPTPARLSHTRNIAMDSSNIMHLVYFSSNATDTWIRKAYSTDPSGLVWDYDNDVYDGAADGYDSARDPGMLLDDNGIWHAAFILHTNSPVSTESLVYCRSTDGTAWDTPLEAYSIAGQNTLDDPTMEMVQFGDYEILVITYLEGDTVYLVYSWDEGDTWTEPVELSTGSDVLPDTCVDQNGYVHTLWEHDKGGDLSIDYIRAHFVEM